MAAISLAEERVWFDKPIYDKAECQHFERLAKANNIEAKSDVSKTDVSERLTAIENENRELKSAISELKILLEKLQIQANTASSIASRPAIPVPEKADDDDVDLFGSDSEGEDAEAAKIREERLAAYAAKKSKKPVLIAKSNIIFDVKPWDDETDMKAMEAEVRKITCDGLLWGAAKLVPLAYGIQKLQISCVVEDDKVSVDWLTEEIQKNEDMVQSVDIAAFNKV